MLAALGFITVIAMLILIMTKKASPAVALIIVPLITGIIACAFIVTDPEGAPGVVNFAANVKSLGGMIAGDDGLLSVAATGVMFIFSILFFLLILLLCVRETAVVDIVGKILTPALLIGLLVLIVIGVVNPIGPVGRQPLVENVAATGVEAGYQTMDVLAAIVFGYIILKSAREKGHTESRAQIRVISGASLVAGAGLLVVYLGLTYLGATTARFFDITVDRTYLVVAIVRNLLGDAGIILFAVVVALACITTAVGLVSACANYFSDLSRGRLSYQLLVCIICVFSAVVSNFGLNEIIAIASPILSVVYPPTLVLIVLALTGQRIRRDWVFRLAALGALAVSLLEVVRTYTGAELAFLDLLPLSSLGFGWVLPAAVCGVIGALLPARSSSAP